MGDFEAWDVDEGPPRGFAEKVAAAAWDSSKREGARRRRVLGASVVVALVSAAAAAALVVHPAGSHAGPSRGEASAAGQRSEVAVGSRAIAVLESGAHLSWSGDEVTQTEGDVFYRVEKQPGAAPFVVHTAAGDVTVLGTCFRVKVNDMNGRDIKAGVVGAAAGALALVGVYEGHVAVSHAGERVDVRAGQSAQVDGRGVHPTGDIASGEQAFSAAAASDDPLLAANQNLADQVEAYKRQLAQNQEASKTLQARLKAAETKLAAQESDGAPPRNPYDPSPDDWKQMAKDGTVVARYPCSMSAGWTPSQSLLDDVGLPAEDAPVLSAAYDRSVQRMNDVVMSGCGQVLGADMASRLGPEICEAVIRSSVKGEAQTADLKKVAQIRAGELPVPAPGDSSVDPLERMLLAQTDALPQLQSDLARSLGPDLAHRVAYDDDLSACASRFSSKPDPQLPPR